MNSQQWEVFETPDPVALEETRNEEEASVAESGRKNEDIDASPLPEAEQAFEVFCGKRFVSGANVADAGAGGVKHQVFESPFERYHRLRSEVDAFVEDLGILAEESSAGAEEALRPYEQLSRQVVTLQAEMESVSQNPSFAPLVQNTSMSNSLDHQTELTQIVQNRLAQAIHPTNTQNHEEVPEGEENTKLELFYTPTTATATTQAQIAVLEERIARIEKVIGLSDPKSASPLPISGSSLVDMVSHLENKVSLMDINTLAAVSRKLTTLGAEIDSLQIKHQDVNHEIVSSQLDAMLEKLERCDGVAQTLPILVGRLKSLQGLHSDASMFGGRLQQVESSFGSIQDMLETDKELLENVNKGMAGNLESMQENLKILTERMEALNSK